MESSYFFRLSTLAPALMAEIAAGGGEASYHYEELSWVAKRRRLRSRSDALRALPEARDRFAENLQTLRMKTGLPMRVVASHGDFVNRRLGYPTGWFSPTPSSAGGSFRSILRRMTRPSFDTSRSGISMHPIRGTGRQRILPRQSELASLSSH